MISGQAAHTRNHELPHVITIDCSPHDAVEAPVNIEEGPLPSTIPSGTEYTSPRASLVASTASSRLWHEDPVSEFEPFDGPALSDTDQDSFPLLDFPSPSGARPVLTDNGPGGSEAASK